MPKNSRTKDSRWRPAFSIVPVLLVSALAFACVIAATSFVKVHERKNAAITAKHSARSAVLAGTLVALGNLQTYAGTDRCTTAEIDKKRARGWLGCWHNPRAEKEFPDFVPLVSNFGQFASTNHCFLRDPDDPSAVVEVPWEQLGENARIAFFIRDESLRASVKKREDAEHLSRFEDDTETLTRIRQQIPRRVDLSTFFENENFDAQSLQEKIARAPDLEILLNSFDEFSENTPRTAEILAALTTSALGVPADPVRGQLKTDLSDKNARDTDFPLPEDTLYQLRTQPQKYSLAGTPVATTPPCATASDALGFFDHPFPLVAELKIHFGFFNPRSDGQHRARFHVTTKFWNPFSFPLLAHGDGRLGLFDAENLPPLCIENLNTGAEILFSPTNFPVGRFGLVRQTPSDKTCNAYAKIFDTTPQGFGTGGNGAGLHGGEVYLARFPQPQAQPSGLARNVGGSSWKFQKGKNPAKAPSGLKTPNAWFHAEHEIRVSSLPSLFSSTLYIRGDAGSLRQQAFPESYSEPVVVFKNVSFPAFSLKMTGADYNRQTASDYDVSQASLVWKIRLRAEDADAMNALFSTIDPRSGIFDFSVPTVKNAFEISTLTGKDAREEAALGDTPATSSESESPLWDRFPNEHQSDTAEAFSCVRIFDFPAAPTLSVGALRHFPYAAFPPNSSFGFSASDAVFSKSRSEKFSPNEAFDRFHFSEIDHNPHREIPQTNAEKTPLVNGAFNINSENADAWSAVLAHDIPLWSRTGSASTKSLSRAFFTQPHSAGTPLPGALSREKIFTDAEFSRLSQKRRERAMATQGVRDIKKTTLNSFAKKIVSLLEERRKHGEKPFKSLEEFVDSGLLSMALRETNFNKLAKTEIPNWLPFSVSQASIMESLAPNVFTRGDTFTIFCRAEVFDPFSKKMRAAACAEMRVQRVAEFFDKTQGETTSASEQNSLNRAFGRRFKIVSFRYIPSDEL